VKHRREKEEIFFADERDFDIGITPFFELQRRIKTAEAATEDENTSLLHGFDIYSDLVFPERAMDGRRWYEGLSGL
jgi:hypothetical protein